MFCLDPRAANKHPAHCKMRKKKLPEILERYVLNLTKNVFRQFTACKVMQDIFDIQVKV